MPLDDAGRIVALAGQCRRRLRVLRTLSSVSWTAPIALAGVASVLRLFPAFDPATVGLAGAATAACLGLGFAWWRSPGIRDAGALLDRRLSLDNYMVAALDLRGSTDAVAGLIAQGAWERVRAVKPRDAFPVNLRRPAIRAVGGIAIATALWPGLGPADSPVLQTPAISGGAPGSGFRPARLPSEGQPRMAVPAGSPAMPGAPAVPEASRAAARRAEDGPVHAAAVSAGRAAGESVTRAGGRGVGRSSGVSRADLAADSPAPSRGSGRALDRTSAQGTGIGLRGEQANGASGLTTDTNARRRGAGGVGGGPLDRSRVGSQTRRNLSPRYGASGDAGSRLESAMTAGEIPPRLRSYVRDYFTALGASERK